MAWNTCNIVLHGGSNGFYFTNDIITGSVVLEFKRKCKLEQINLHITGVAKATWSRPSPTLPYIKIYSETKKVLDISLIVFKELQGKTVKPSVMSCQFNFMLPPDLPPTYKDSIAKVNYKITISSKNVCKLMSTQMINFTVVNRVNINHMQEFKIPMVYELEKIFGKSKIFLMTIKTYRGFAPSQQIPFEAIINNEKKVNVKKISVTLIQKIDYTVSSGLYNTENIICETEYTEILNNARQICRFAMDIPHVISSTMNQIEPMVNISYTLQVKVNFRFHLPAYIDIPVTVASIPVTHSIFYK